MTRMILIALHAAVITTLTQTVLRAAAAPLPLPMTVSLLPVLSSRDVSRPFPRSMRIVRNMTSYSLPTTFARTISSGAEFIEFAGATTENSTADSHTQLVNFHRATKQNSRNLKKLAAQSASSKANDVAFQRKCIAQLNAFHSNILGQQAALSAIVDEKHKTLSGRSDHNEDHASEKLLKDIITACKDGLNSCQELVKNIPILGPSLAPITYDVKCLLDTVLNYCRDFLVDILKGLPPAVANLLGA